MVSNTLSTASDDRRDSRISRILRQKPLRDPPRLRIAVGPKARPLDGEFHQNHPRDEQEFDPSGRQGDSEDLRDDDESEEEPRPADERDEKSKNSGNRTIRIGISSTMCADISS